MKLAVEGTEYPFTITTYRKARISTTVEMKRGPTQSEEFRILICKKLMTEVLFPKTIFLSLGFNLQEYLSLVRKDIHDTEFSYIGFDLDFGLGTDTSPTKTHSTSSPHKFQIWRVK